MVGTMGDVTIADAIIKNISGFNYTKAYECIRKNAFKAPPDDIDYHGRQGLNDYLKYNYIPHDSIREEVSRTLNYILSDYAIAQAALYLGYHEDYNILINR